MIIDKRGKILDWKRGNARRGSFSIEEVVAVAVSAYFDTHIVLAARNVQNKTAILPVKDCRQTLICETLIISKSANSSCHCSKSCNL